MLVGRSRIAHHIDFPDYTAEKLAAIGKLMLAAQNYRYSADAEKSFMEYLWLRMTMKHFANAGSVRNALDRARLRQANRLFASRAQKLAKADLMTIEAEDILASQVFVQADDQSVLAWREFGAQARSNLHEPITAEVWLYHYRAGLVMGTALDDMHEVLEKKLRLFSAEKGVSRFEK